MTERKQIIIRAGRYADMLPMEEVMRAAIAESEVPLPPYEIPAAYHWYIDLVAMRFVYVAECDGRVVGAIFLGIMQWPWSHDDETKHISVPALYVLPEFRRSGTALKLIEKAEDRAREAGRELFLELTNGVDAEKKSRFLRNMGYKQAGGSFWKRPS